MVTVDQRRFSLYCIAIRALIYNEWSIIWKEIMVLGDALVVVDSKCGGLVFTTAFGHFLFATSTFFLFFTY